MLQQKIAEGASSVTEKLSGEKKIDPHVETQKMLEAASSDSSTAADVIRNILQNYCPDYVSVDTLDKSGYGMIHYAVQHGNVDVLKCLLAHGADIGLQSGATGAYTPGHMASDRGNYKFVARCVLGGYAVNGITEQGQTMLHLACNSHRSDVVWMLVTSLQADVNVQDEMGRTALHEVAKYGNEDLAELLLSHGAKMLRTTYGKTPVDVANDYGLFGFARLIEPYARGKKWLGRSKRPRGNEPWYDALCRVRAELTRGARKEEEEEGLNLLQDLMGSDPWDLPSEALPSVRLYTWGRGHGGVLFTGDERQKQRIPILARVLGNRPIFDVAFSGRHALALRSHKGIPSVLACGDSYRGQLGAKMNRRDGRRDDSTLSAAGALSIAASADPLRVDFSRVEMIDPVMGHVNERPRCVKVGIRSSYALFASGRVCAWGGNKFGQLGLGDATDRSIPRWVTGFGLKERVVQIATGDYFVVTLTARKKVYSWGLCSDGRLGTGDFKSSGCSEHKDSGWDVKEGTRFVSRPREVPKISGSTLKIAAGRAHAAALVHKVVEEPIDDIDELSGLPKTQRISLPVVYTWGSGARGQLGHGSDSSCEYVPRLVEVLKFARVAELHLGHDHSFAYVKTRKRLYAFGAGKYGQLGTGDLFDRCKPIEVRTLRGHEILRMACGARHSLALTNQGLFSWGDARDGQLGHGTERLRVVPFRCTGASFAHTQVLKLYAGPTCSAAIVVSDVTGEQ